jgi:UDP-N-acetylmuramate dehydrogenase
MQKFPFEPDENVPLAAFTTLDLGGPASYLVEARSRADLVHAMSWAHSRRVPVTVLGGGSNVVIADEGFDGLVIRVCLRGLDVDRRRDGAYVTAAAGETWDDVVGWAVDEGLAGIECLSGIPGTAGATPIQNVGAYGQEVADTISRVDVLDRTTDQHVALTSEDCRFSYRGSRFRTTPDRFLVLAVTYLLEPGGPPTVRYPQLAEALAPFGATPSLAEVRDTVLALRGSKSMVLAADDPNRRSVGSFFVNPVVSAEAFDRIQGRCPGDDVPRFSNPDGRIKIPAAWLIERSGFPRGFTRGAVGVSSRHSLALVHHGGGSTADLIELARDIRRSVQQRFGVDLKPEPTFLGFEEADPTGDPARASSTVGG